MSAINAETKIITSTVVNLATGDEQTFTLHPIYAVCAAYAQAQGDYDTENYREGGTIHLKYLEKVVLGSHTVACGDFTVNLDAYAYNGIADIHTITVIRSLICERVKKGAKQISVGTYINQDMSSLDLGHKQFMLYGDQCDFQDAPKVLPDTFDAINWRYQYVGDLDIYTNQLVQKGSGK